MDLLQHSSLNSAMALPAPLLLLLLLCARSSPALSANAVSYLPGLSGQLPFSLETGYVTVDEVNGAELFYYFIESEENPGEDPLLIWLTGGDRCSVFSGLVMEIGPVRFVISPYNGTLPALEYNPYSWTKFSNILFVDSPVGAGFSFSRNYQGYNVTDMSSSMQLYKFVLQWFLEHPQFLSNPLYIAGDSKAGIYATLLTQAISEGIEARQQPLLNLKGYILGNPVTRDKIDLNARIPFAHGMGIISDELFQSWQRNCDGQDYRNPSTIPCAATISAFDKVISEIQLPYILDAKCIYASPKPELTLGNRRSMVAANIKLNRPPPQPALYCKSYAGYLSYYWANSNVTRAALHVRKGTVEEWVRCNDNLPFKYEIESTIKYHKNLTSAGYRALVYSGDHDMVVPFIGTRTWVKSLNYTVVDSWRSWHVDGQVAGYMVAYENDLTFATVKGGGHTAPTYRAKECYALARRWISHVPL